MSSKVTTIDLSNFNTSNVTNMSEMFLRIQATNIDVSNFDTSNVVNMQSMFAESQATTLDISNFDTSSVTNMAMMFGNALNLERIYISAPNDDGTALFDISNLEVSNDMFYGSTNLVGGAGTVYNENYTDAEYAHIDYGEEAPGYFTDVADKK